MKPLHFIELPVGMTIARCRRANPFHWALLKALRVFVPGARPDFDRLAERLRILERSFLDRAWAEIRELKAADDDDFAQAKLTALGEEALVSRYFTLGEPDLRMQSLYFNKQTGEILRAAKFEVAVGHAVRAKPAWSEQLNAEQICAALAVQAPKQALKSDERLLAFSLHWQEAQEVKVTLEGRI